MVRQNGQFWRKYLTTVACLLAMAGINMVVAEIRQGGEQVQTNSTELSLLAEQPNILVGQFRI